MPENTVPQNPTPQSEVTTGGLINKTREFLVAQGKPVPPPSSTPLAVVSVRGITNLVDALVAKGLLTAEQAKQIKFESATANKDLETVLLEKGLVTDLSIQQTKSEMFGIGFVDLPSISIDPQILAKLPKEAAGRMLAVVFEENEARVKVAMVNPLDLQQVKFVESFVGKHVDAYYASRQAIQQIIDTRYGAQIGKEVSQALEDVEVVNISNNQIADLSENNISTAPVAKIVNMILDYAVKHKASDVHIEPREQKISVRFRVNGVLSERLSVPTTLGPSLISRIKILSNLKIDEHRVPQDGRFQIKSDQASVDVRVSVMPSIYGEKVVMRLLEKGSGVISLEQTGLRGPAFKMYMDALHKTQGIILITGPTGSGKTVTLASSLAHLNKPEVNIVTIEDPVEIRVEGITQVQVNGQVGLTFAQGLRSFLRQDPDIIMVGEIRDQETAALAIQAALVGRLVLATLHTNSAAGALPRLLEMGVEPYLLSSTINLVGAQRLVRKLCDECKQSYLASEEEVEILHRSLDGLKGFDMYVQNKQEKIHFDSETKQVTLYKAVGCPKCGDTGYTGRIGIFEIMEMNSKIGQMIMSHLSANEINEYAVSQGMISMVQDGYMKVIEGITTIEEVLRVQST